MTTQNLQSGSVPKATHRGDSSIDPAWATDAPLKLVAWALESMPDRTGKAGKIQEVIEGRVSLNPKWGTWWAKNVRPMVADASEHFDIGKDNSVKLLSDVENVPLEPLPSSRNKRGKGKTTKTSRTAKERGPSKLEAQWMAWFRGDEEGPPPTRGRTKEAHNALEKCAAEDVKRALHRTNLAAAELLEGRAVPKQAAEAWAKLLSRAASRWRGHNELDGDDDLPKSVGEYLALLVQEAGYPYESGQWLRQAGGMTDEQPTAWPRIFLAGVWRALDNSIDSPKGWFKSSFNRSAFEDQVAIAQAMAAAGLATSGSSYRCSQLDSLLSFLSAEQQKELMQNLIVQSACGNVPKDRVLSYIEHIAQYGKSSEWRGCLSLTGLASILLTEGSGAVVEQAAYDVAGALVDDALECPSEPQWDGLLSEGRRRIDELRERYVDDLEKQRQRYESELEKHRQEEERLERTVQRLRAEIAAGREVSRMDILQDVLTVITETLQSLRKSEDSSEQMRRRVEANLALALRASGAEEFGAIDDTVPYDPTLHQSEEHIASGSPVRIVVPGTLIPGKLAGDRVLIKAGVVGQTEVN